MKRVMMRVTGEVQGVWYRASARQAARQFGVTGYVRNMADGTVEILAHGGDHAVDALVDWAKEGSEAAVVADVLLSDYDGDDLYLDFEVID